MIKKYRFFLRFLTFWPKNAVFDKIHYNLSKMLKNDMPIIKALHSFSFSSSSELLDPPQRGVGLIETPLSVCPSVTPSYRDWTIGLLQYSTSSQGIIIQNKYNWKDPPLKNRNKEIRNERTEKGMEEKWKTKEHVPKRERNKTSWRHLQSYWLVKTWWLHEPWREIVWIKMNKVEKIKSVKHISLVIDDVILNMIG